MMTGFLQQSFWPGVALLQGLDFLTTAKTAVMAIITTIALMWAAWNCVMMLIKRKWAEMFGFLLISCIVLYVLDDILMLKTGGKWFMKTFLGIS